MADTLPQTQTTATPAASSPEARVASATPAAPAAVKTESKLSLAESLEAAFAAADTTTETDAPQASRGRTAPTSTAEDDTSEEHTEEDETAEGTEEEEVQTDETSEETPEQTTEEPDEVELDEVDELTAEAMKKIRGADKVPKGFVKRLVKQSAQIRDYKAELAQLKATPPVTITPTDASPLADCDTVETLEQRIADAKEVKKWAKENPYGDSFTRNGREIKITAEDVAERLARAEAEIDAYADRKIALSERNSSRPWEAAERILPEMFKTGSSEQKLATHLLQTCPEIKTRFNDFEVVLAYVLKGHKIATEEASGKAKWVRMELDAKGKPIVKTATSTAAPTVKPKAPASPQATRPALRTTGSTQNRTSAEAIAALPPHLRNDPEARLRASIEAAA